MDLRPRLRRLGTVSIAAMAVVALAARAGSSSATPPTSINSTSASTLPRNVVISLDEVRQYFRQVNQEVSTGPNSTATGNPTATRSVMYASADRSAKVTITVDQFRNPSDALSAYREAIQKSEAAPGFNLLPLGNVGQQSFAGTATVGTETHIGLGALDGSLIVGVTLAGFNASPNNQAQLVVLSRMEIAAAKAAVAGSGRR